MADAPVVDIDMFSVEAIRNARAVDDGLRELAPAVKLSREDITIIGRHEHVKDGLAIGARSRRRRVPGTTPTRRVPRSC